MKIQELAIIFVIIILPISLLLSEFTQLQIKTLEMQTSYDAKLTSATYDAIKAFQLNTAQNTGSAIADSKARDMQAAISSFMHSIISSLKLNGYTEDDLNNYIPALVYTLYDGFYIYSPYENTHDELGNVVTGKKEKIYGVKPYINYSARYINDSAKVDVVITYALDNYITVQGTIDNNYVRRSGYLIDGIEVYEETTQVTYNEIEIGTEQLKEEFMGKARPYFKYNGTKYYYIEEKDQIVYNFNGTIIDQFPKKDGMFDEWKRLITESNNFARQYYKDAYEFTKWLKSTGLVELKYCDAYDEVIDEEGNTDIAPIWSKDERKIFEDSSRNIENELSNFNQHRLDIIRHKIEINLAIAISNYNEFSKGTNVFQMPNLTEEEWEHITNNISLMSFLQGLPIGGKIYNGYSLVTNSESEEVVLEENIYILGSDGNYHRIGDKCFENGGTVEVNAGNYGGTISAGRLNLDFNRSTLAYNDYQSYNYYPLKDFNASYDSIVMQNNVTTYDDIYEYINNCKNDDLKKAFYTALGRERFGNYSTDFVINESTLDKYLLTFEPGGNLGHEEIPSQIIKTEWETITLPDKVLYKEGYIFLGWSEGEKEKIFEPNKDYNDYKIYKPGEEYIKDKNVTLYPTWQRIPEKYSIIYDDNAEGFIKVPDVQTKTELEDLNLSEEVPTRKGYIFKGWDENPNAIEPQYQPGGIYKDDKHTLLYAIWEQIIYTVKYDSNGGNHYNTEDTTIKVEHASGDTVQIARDLDEPIREGYNFLGWSEEPSAKTGAYKNTDTFICEKDITLYAIWELKTYIVNYDANEGNGAPSSQTKTHGMNLTLSEQQPTRTGYDFLGWAKTKSSTSSEYSSGGIYNKNESVTLYAVWQLKTYTVSYNANGGNGAPNPQTKEYGKDLTLSTVMPKRTGYNFLGWSTIATTSNVDYNSGGTYIKNEPVTLYAVWQLKTYKITYNANGGTGAPSEQIKEYGKDIKLSTEIPERTGYDFLGWATSSTATNLEYASGAIYAINEDLSLYAIWGIKKYTVSYDANGGSGAPNPQIKTHGTDLKLATDEPSRTGYNFLGWATSSTASSATYQPGETYKTEANTTLYAVWKIKTYTVTYNANGGSGAPSAQIKTHGEKLTLSSKIPEREGHDFLGWGTTSTSTNVEYMPEGTYTTNEELTLYAIWGIKTYTVQYDANGGSGAPGVQTKKYGESINLSSTEPSKSGYDFIGWATTSTATNAEYVAGEKYTKNENVTLYAVWKIKTYEVSYNANGGNGAPSTQIKTHGKNLELSKTIPEREGHNFLGWAKTASAASAEYVSGGIYTTNADMTLYAVWEKKTYEVKYNANGGSGAPSSQLKVYGEDLTLSSARPERDKDGYDFQGWATTSTATDAEYAAGGKYTKNEEVTLYAVWRLKTYAVLYNANGGSGAPSSQTKIHGKDLTLSTTNPTRTGYNFQGWSKSSSATSVDYNAGGTYTTNANVTLYAVWDTIKYTVTYNAKGGTGAPSAQIKEHGKNLTLSSTIPTKDGYIFQGWSTSSSANSVNYDPGDTYTANANVTLYAVWKIRTYSVLYNANGGIGAPSSQTKVHGTDLKLSTTTPEREGYNFLGWSASSSALVGTYSPGGTYTTNANITLYAIWDIKTYTVTYNANGGTGAPSAQTKVHGTSLKLSTTIPKRDNYNFLGWATTSTATSAKYGIGGYYGTNADVTLYAVWKIKTYEVKYNANGGSGAPSTQTKEHGKNLTLSSTKPTRNGYTFLGWGKSSTDLIGTYSAGGTYAIDADITLYAIWKNSNTTYKITINANNGSFEGTSNTSISLTKNYGETVSFDAFADEPYRSGYTFLGWNTNKSATTAQYQHSDSFTCTGAATYYAIWKKN